MKKILVTLLIAVIAVMSLASCGAGHNKLNTGKQTNEEVDYTVDNEISDDNDAYEDTDEELPEGFERTYGLTNLQFFDPEAGTWVDTDFVPDSEQYVFHEDLTCEYTYKNYPTYEDMLNDSNYVTETRNGFYMYVPENDGVTMIYEDYPVTASIDGDKLIIEQDYNGSPAVRGTYTLAE